MLSVARIAGAVVVAAAIGFSIHVLYGQGWAEAYVQRAADMGRLNGALHQPYPTTIVVIAALTALVPTAGKVLAYILLKERLPGRSRIVKGLAFGLLVLLMGDALIRLPLMNAVIGNPFDVVLVQSLEGWLIAPLMGIAIALLVP